MQYFWFHRPEDGFPPEPVQTPIEPPGPDRLCVACTQTSLTPSAQRRLAAHWCALFPTLTNVRFLWLSSRATQELFDAVCSMPQLEGLWIKWSGIRTIDRLPALSNLHYFHLGSSTSVTSLDALRQMKGLRWLGLENVKRVREFDVLSHLTQLEGLVLQGSMWSTQRVTTLAPLGTLTSLRYLDISNLRADDKTLQPLYALRNLETFNTAMWWDDGERAEVVRRNPRLVDNTRLSSS